MSDRLHLVLPAFLPSAADEVIARGVALAQTLDADLAASVPRLEVASLAHWFAGESMHLHVHYFNARADVEAERLAAHTHDVTQLGLADDDAEARGHDEELLFNSERALLICPLSRPAPIRFCIIELSWEHIEAGAHCARVSDPGRQTPIARIAQRSRAPTARRANCFLEARPSRAARIRL